MPPENRNDSGPSFVAENKHGRLFVWVSGTCLLGREGPMSQVVSSKQPKHGLTQELSFSRISESNRLHIYPMWDLGIDTR